MTDWKIGHYAYGPQDGSSVWHVGSKTIRECNHEECRELAKEWDRTVWLRERLNKLEEAAKRVLNDPKDFESLVLLEKAVYA